MTLEQIKNHLLSDLTTASSVELKERMTMLKDIDLELLLEWNKRFDWVIMMMTKEQLGMFREYVKTNIPEIVYVKWESTVGKMGSIKLQIQKGMKEAVINKLNQSPYKVF